MTTLGEIADVVGGATPKTAEPALWDGGIPWVTPKDLSDLEGDTIGSTPRTISEAGLRSCGATLLPAGSVLLSSRAPIGHVAINSVPMATNQGFKSLVPEPGRVDAKFLYWWLKRNRPLLESLGNGATFKEISKRVTASIPIELPPIEEQRRIAAVLDAADALRAKRRQAIATLNAFEDAAFSHTFGDPAASGYSSAQFGELLSIPLRNGVSPSKSGGVTAQVLSLSAITGHSFDAAAVKSSTFATAHRPEKLVTEGDFLICRGNGNLRLVGRGAFPESSMSGVAFPDTMIAARLQRDALDDSFLAKIWGTGVVRRQLESAARTTNGTHKVNQAMVESVVVPVPPIELQREYGQVVSSVRGSRQQHERSAGALDRLFASLQQRAFRGEL